MFNAALILTLNLCTAAPVVTVKPISGPSVEGTVTELSSKQLVVDSDGSIKRFQTNALLSVRPIGIKSSTSAPKIRVTLVDKSVLFARAYTTKKNVADIELADGRKVKVNTRSIDHVRWYLAPQLDKAWKTALAAKRTGDAVIVRDGTSLDELEGILNDIDDTRVGFTFDGKRRRVTRKRLAGVVYFHAGERQLPDPICKITDRSGSTWFIREMQMKGGNINFQSVTGDKSNVPMDQIVAVDFSTGNLVFLSDLEPTSVSWNPYVENTASQSLAKFFQPKRNKGFNGKKLQLNDIQYDKGFAVYSRTQMVFRLPGKFKSLNGIAGISRSQNVGHVTLIIRGDNKQLLRKDIAAGDKPLPINLKLKGIRRITILVDFGKNLDIGDRLQLCDMRITK